MKTAVVLTAVLIALPGIGLAQSACDPAPARAVSVQGTVEARRAGANDWQAVRLNDTFCPGDAIRVQERSRADITLLDQSVLRLNANSTITVEAPKERTTGVVDLVRGAVHFFSRGPRSLEVNTPFTVAGVRGTEFLIILEPERTLLTVFEGTVLAENPAGSLTLRDGESGLAEKGKPPVPRIVVRPRDAVHWALYYPPVIHSPQAPGYHAQGLLALGAVDEARAALNRALKATPNDANALSLQSIMAVVQGERDRGLQLAQAAVAADAKSASALVARSYAEQARFDLAAARASVQRAVELEPNNALAWARLAELHSSFGELDRAMSAARRAVEIDPNLSRTQTVLGFAHLTAINTREARQSFEKAIALDQADPLPRLGLGLAKIRDSDLDAGARDIEIAASLDPNNALVRSYLGKAYYEEKRSPLDEREFGVAMQLDPMDPTPLFYDAIAKQTTNRPVEALQQMERATELNDNRAVYRSRLLLDSDAAARSASLARIYSELGFQQLALVEGWKSVNIDPTNSSAHRFLADSYAALPRHEIARVSELLQSQLLQPLNATPIQPRLAESNLGLIAAAGPETLSFNEFNPLFNRNGLTLLASGLLGSNDTRAWEAVAAGIHGRTGLSIGYTDFETDGWRVNARQEDRIANLFVQSELSPRTSLQAELRRRDRRLGDPEMRFFFEDVAENLRQTEERSTYRLGIRHAIAPHSILLGSLMHQQGEFFLRDSPDDFFVRFDQEFPRLRSTGGELQHLYRSGRFSVTSGIGHVGIDAKQTFIIGFAPPFDFLDETVETDEDIRHSNAYVYGYAQAMPGITVTLGASYDAFETDSLNNRERDQFNPKFGVTWTPMTGTTLRAAAFRVLTRSLVADQTLEPTQVAGFNQFFDDVGGTDSRRYGIALDQKFSRTLFGGVEVSRRDLNIPFRFVLIDEGTGDVLADEVRRGDGREEVGRAYVFWTPHRWIALSAEYQRERFTNEEDVAFSFRKVLTERVPLGVRLLHPSGFGAWLRGTHFRQRGEFRRLDAFECCEAGSDDFFLVDAALTYRLPRRHGLITVGVRNVTDRHFRYQETDLSNASIQPGRTAFARVTLAF
jgi:tetratricopeptide (TPR) repeat protein